MKQLFADTKCQLIIFVSLTQVGYPEQFKYFIGINMNAIAINATKLVSPLLKEKLIKRVQISFINL